MKLFKKIKKYGIKNAINVFFLYKLEPVIAYIFRILFIPLKLQDVIVFSSHNDFDMNSGSLYKYILEKDNRHKYKLIWFVENLQHIDLPKGVIQVQIKGIHIRRYYWNAVAKFIFYDDTIIHKWKDGQKVVYLGHATRAMKNCRGKVPVPADVDFICSSSEDNDKLMSEVYVCSQDKMLHTGFPVTDLLYKRWNELAKVSKGKEYAKVIIWMPTFRKSSYNVLRNDSDYITETGLSLIESIGDAVQLNEFLIQKNILLLIKFHPAQDMNEINMPELDNIVLLSPERIKELGIDTYKLLTETDGLISDYSSISFDYLILDRPIAYVLVDYNSYKLGFAVDNPKDYMPGKYLYNKEDMNEFISDIAKGKDTRKNDRKRVRDSIAKYNDGGAAEKIVSYFSIL